MAELGFRTINEMVGQVDNLDSKAIISPTGNIRISISLLFFIKNPLPCIHGLYKQEEQDHGIAECTRLETVGSSKAGIGTRRTCIGRFFNIKNTDRTTGTILSNEITKKYRAEGLPDDTIHFKFKGTAGQSFGAFNTNGITHELEGDANDYFGKGLSGAKLIIYPDQTIQDSFLKKISSSVMWPFMEPLPESFIRGKAGERFCVRNSGADAVVEGVGDHGCEYMTGGRVVILGETGRNFAAGMSGGIAYVYDVKGKFAVQLQ